ncbi:MAG: type II 3-dehydroquinate dehydratase [Actinobacteria bacterium]|jgi:3-dehydroquinate dehydratase II|nr:type II 3-dehydroquinate dehydratase [Actinomycetota bacterium]MDA2996584.1 type II 3-dehydroquinate dehydratase [Actinomycetota bacterium]
MKVLVLNGPNLGRLDLRDSNIYGNLDFAGLKSEIVSTGKELGFECDVRQSDSEVEIISWLHEAADTNTPVVINPAAFTHYSYAIRDAADMVKAPLIEVHLSNPMSREEFRHTSVISGVANGTIAGFGPDSYRLALIALSRMAK